MEEDKFVMDCVNFELQVLKAVGERDGNVLTHLIDFLKEKVTVKKEYVLLDEYDTQISVEDFLALVQDKQKTSNIDDFEHGAKNIDGYSFCESDFS